MEDAAPHLAHLIMPIIEEMFSKHALLVLLLWLAILGGIFFAGAQSRGTCQGLASRCQTEESSLERIGRQPRDLGGACRYGCLDAVWTGYPIA